MKSDVETLSPTRVRLSVEVPFDELTPNLDAAYRKIAQQVSIPGFRKGKVPARVIDQRVGRGAVLEEAVNEALPQAYGAAVEENQVRVLGRPEVEMGAYRSILRIQERRISALPWPDAHDLDEIPSR